MRAALLLLALLASPTAALGVDFAQMPVGCSWTFTYANGHAELHRYVGLRNGRYTVTVATPSGRVTQVNTYDNEGELTRKAHPDGSFTDYSPHMCYDVPGHCRMRISPGNGPSYSFSSDLTPAGNGYQLTTRVEGEAPQTGFLQFTRFHLIALEQGRGGSYRLTGFRGCGANS